MKKLFITMALLFTGTFLLQANALQLAGAQFDPLEKPCESINSGDDANAICEDSNASNGPNPITGDGGIISNVANILSFVAAIIAVFVIIIAGITMMTSGGDAGKVTASRNTIIYTVVGLVVIVLARTIVVFVFGYLLK